MIEVAGSLPMAAPSEASHLMRFSSILTWGFKVAFPLVWMSVSGILLVAGIMAGGEPIEEILVPLGLLLGGGVLFVPLAVLLKKVYADDRYVYLYGLRRAITVPLSQIDSVQERWVISPKRAFIVFRDKTPFGKTVMFLPAEGIFSYFEISLAVRELRRRAGFQGEWRPR